MIREINPSPLPAPSVCSLTERPRGKPQFLQDSCSPGMKGAGKGLSGNLAIQSCWVLLTDLQAGTAAAPSGPCLLHPC